MKRSTERVLTTHVGALVRPPALDALVQARLRHEPYDTVTYESLLRESVREVVEKQVAAGIDVVDDGEYGKTGGWIGYVNERIKGYRSRAYRDGELPTVQAGKDRERFAQFYADMGFMGLGRPAQTGTGGGVGQVQECVEPLSYVGQQIVKRDIANLKAALASVQVEEAFLPAIAPASLEPSHRNAHYPTQEAYVEALAGVMREEYQLIAQSGVLLQIDDAWIPALWDRMVDSEADEPAFYRFAEFRIEALNHATEGIPTNRIRYHVCWGSWHGPHLYDMPMAKLLPLLLKVRAGAYLFEAGNVRHEHEWRAWEDAKVPDGSILIPGVVSHATNVIEHPDLVAERIQRYAGIVGRENVIAGTDCGMGNRIHPQLAYAKFQAMAEGARLATRALWSRGSVTSGGRSLAAVDS